MKNKNMGIPEKKILDKRAVKMIPALDGEQHNSIYLEQLEKLSIHAYEENKSRWKRYKMLIRSSPLFSVTFGVAIFAILILIFQIAGRLNFVNTLLAGSIAILVSSLLCLVLISIFTYKRDDIQVVLLELDTQSNMFVAKEKNEVKDDMIFSEKTNKESDKTKIIVAVIAGISGIAVALIGALL